MYYVFVHTPISVDILKVNAKDQWEAEAMANRTYADLGITVERVGSSIAPRECEDIQFITSVAKKGWK